MSNDTQPRINALDDRLSSGITLLEARLRRARQLRDQLIKATSHLLSAEDARRNGSAVLAERHEALAEALLSDAIDASGGLTGG